MGRLKLGIVLLGHGSRVPEANQGLRELAAKVSRHFPGAAVEVGYLAHGRPNVEEAVAAVVERGVQEVLVVPLFLFDGMHVQRDIPRHLEALGQRYPGLRLRCTPSLGADRRIAEIVVERIREVRGE